MNGKDIISNGTVTQASGFIETDGASTWTNNGVFELSAASSLNGNNSGVASSLVLTNTASGTLRNAGGTNSFTAGVTVHNQGAVQVNAGTLNLGGNERARTGSFNALSGATLGFSGGTHNFNPLSSVTVAAGGTLAASGGAVVQLDADATASLSGAISVSGNLTQANLAPGSGTILPTSISMSDGTLNLTPPNATISPVSVSISNGGVANLNSAAVTIGDLDLTNGTLGGTGHVTLAAPGLGTGTHSWAFGTLGGAGDLTIASGATFALITGSHTLNGKDIINNGTVTQASGFIETDGASTWTNNGVFELSAASSLNGNNSGVASSLVLTNTASGTLRNAGGTNSFTAGVTVHNQGAVQVNAGTLNLGGNGGTHTGSFNALSGATLGLQRRHAQLQSALERHGGGRRHAGGERRRGGAAGRGCDGEPERGDFGQRQPHPGEPGAGQRHDSAHEHQHERRHAEPDPAERDDQPGERVDQQRGGGEPE